jgi:hypothetical protein
MPFQDESGRKSAGVTGLTSEMQHFPEEKGCRAITDRLNCLSHWDDVGLALADYASFGRKQWGLA